MKPERAYSIASQIRAEYAMGSKEAVKDAILQACAEEREAFKPVALTRLLIQQPGKYEAWVNYSGALPTINIRKMR